MKTQTDLSLDDFRNTCNQRIDALYVDCLRNVPALELKTAMEYALFNGGKRLRPLLVYATGSIFNTPVENLDIPAAAVELIHTYSLIHDDLPCMDDADLRRGKPSCHKMFSEGMAVLAGDALHTLTMQLIATHPAPLNATKRVHIMAALSQACGPFGMAAGQALDLTVMNDLTISSELLHDVYRLKTGALFSACIELGRMASHDEDDINQRALRKFGECIGLAFQIQDDILDIEAETAELGKTQGIDAINHKTTYPKLVGLNVAKDQVQTLYQEALETINYLGDRARLLRELVSLMLARKY